MDYINFGAAGVKVSRLALGMGLRGQADETVALRLIEYAIDQGINLIDCANIYGPLDDRANSGRSEAVCSQPRPSRVKVPSGASIRSSWPLRMRRVRRAVTSPTRRRPPTSSS